MVGISIQTKNASYYNAINTNKKTAKGVVGVFHGKYAKNTKSSFSSSSAKASAVKKEQYESRKKLLDALDNGSTSKSNTKNTRKLTDKEAAELAAFEAAKAAAENNELSQETAERFETVKKAKKQVVFVGTIINKQNGYLDLSKTKSEKPDKKVKKKINYSYKDVSSKIQRAKTSLSAGQAVISAKRKVMELHRKASSGNVDSEDLQLALSHAKKMEMIAKKKKRNLELEEMVEHVQAQDEREEKIKDSSASQNDVIDVAKETIENAEDEIKKQQEDYASELEAEFEELAKEYETEDYTSEELMEAFSDEMSEMMEAFGQEEMELLEETMEMLEQLEAVNPHMSDDQLKNLKRKHRASEDKAIAKANMEYLKGVMKQLEKESHKSAAAVASPQTCTYSLASVLSPMVAISIPAGTEVDVDC